VIAASSSKKNGPASAATDPDRGSNINRKEEAMNNSVRITNCAPRAKRFLELETQACELTQMARILADMLASELSGEKVGSECISVTLTRQQLGKFSFAWNDVANRARTFEDAFFAALDGTAA